MGEAGETRQAEAVLLNPRVIDDPLQALHPRELTQLEVELGVVRENLDAAKGPLPDARLRERMANYVRSL